MSLTLQFVVNMGDCFGAASIADIVGQRMSWQRGEEVGPKFCQNS